jgi:hypothetical protein
MSGKKQQDSRDSLFRTRDLPLAAYLALHQISYDSMERQGKHGFWVYKRSDRLDQLIAIYENGEVTIDLRDYLDCVSKIRSDLYAYLDVE